MHWLMKFFNKSFRRPFHPYDKFAVHSSIADRSTAPIIKKRLNLVNAPRVRTYTPMVSDPDRPGKLRLPTMEEKFEALIQLKRELDNKLHN